MGRMQITETIAILGATKTMGSIVARNLATKNYRLLLSDVEDSQINKLIRSILVSAPYAEVESIACSFDACWQADNIITDLPANTEKQIAEKIRAVANQKTLIQLLPAASKDRLLDMQAILPHTHLIHVISRFENHPKDALSAATLISSNNKHLEAAKKILTDAGITASPASTAKL